MLIGENALRLKNNCAGLLLWSRGNALIGRTAAIVGTDNLDKKNQRVRFKDVWVLRDYGQDCSGIKQPTRN